MGRPIGSSNKHPAIIPTRGTGIPKPEIDVMELARKTCNKYVDEYKFMNVEMAFQLGYEAGRQSHE